MIKITFVTNDIKQVATFHYYQMFLKNKEFDITIVNPELSEVSENSDFLIIPPYKDDLRNVDKLRKTYKRLCFLDPRNFNQAKLIKSQDIVIIDSIEQFDFASKFTKNIFIYSEFPLFEINKKRHLKKSNKINIYYHGNKVHLNSSKYTLLRALKRIESKYDITFHVCYNYKKLGKFKFDLDSVIYHQWHKNIHKEISKEMDIGVAPNFIPVRANNFFKKILSSRKNNSSGEDYLHRFKIPSNPGRIITMIMMGIPVISDMYPSACQLIKHEYNGFLVSSESGWYNALEKYINSIQLRKIHSERLYQVYENEFEPTIQNEKLYKFLKTYMD